MKILRVIASVDPASGGPIAGLRAITPELRKLGHETEFLSVDDPQATFLNTVGAPVHAWGPTRTAYARSPALRAWLAEHAQEFDAVVMHGLWQDLGLAVRECCTIAGVPYFVFPHGMLDPFLRRMYPVRHFKKWIYWLLSERHVLRAARAVFFTCEEERRLAQKTFPLYSVNECVVKYGAASPPNEFESSPGLLEKEIASPYWLFLGRIHSKKGLDLLLPAYAGFVSETVPQNRAAIPRLVIAGPCHSERYLSQLKGAANALGIGGKIDWPGMLSGDAKWSTLAGAQAFVLPSYQENFGIAVAESLAVGTPVLVSDHVNIWREIVEDGAGFVEPANEAGTLQLFRRWSALSKRERETMRAAAQRCFQTRFQIRAVAEDFATALSTLIRRPDSAG